MLRCPECQAENQDDALTCAACGAPLEGPPAGEETAAGEATAEVPAAEAAPAEEAAPAAEEAAAEEAPAKESKAGREKPGGAPRKERAAGERPGLARPELLGEEAQAIFREDDLLFAPPKRSPFFFVGAIMAAAFGLIVLVDLILYALKALDGDTCYLVFGFSSPVGIVGLILMTAKPTAQRTPAYVAVGKGGVLFYFLVVALAAAFAKSGYLTPSSMLQVFVFGLPAATLGAWLAVYNPHPADLPWYACVAKGLIAAAAHVFAGAVLLYSADIVQWGEIWDVASGCAAAWGLGTLILMVDVLLTPHPTRG